MTAARKGLDMERLPTPTENPEGLHGRYQIAKASGEPVDPDAFYFVLRLDGGGSDPRHIDACREAALTYCDCMLKHIPQLATELRNRVIQEGHDVSESDASSLINAWDRMALEVNVIANEKGFWEDGGNRNKGEMIALMHSELSEALEALRHGNPADDKVPEFSGLEAELADTVIRIMDFAAGFGLNVAGAMVAKIAMNATRAPKHGKQF